MYFLHINHSLLDGWTINSCLSVTTVLREYVKNTKTRGILESLWQNCTGFWHDFFLHLGLGLIIQLGLGLIRRGKSVATWQPGNLVVRKLFRNQALAAIFLDPSPALSPKQTIWWKRKRNYISIFRKWTNILSISSKLLQYEGAFIIRKYVILWTLSSPKIHLQTKSMSFLQKVSAPILRLPVTLLTFSTSGWKQK